MGNAHYFKRGALCRIPVPLWNRSRRMVEKDTAGMCENAVRGGKEYAAGTRFAKQGADHSFSSGSHPLGAGYVDHVHCSIPPDLRVVISRRFRGRSCTPCWGMRSVACGQSSCQWSEFLECLQAQMHGARRTCARDSSARKKLQQASILFDSVPACAHGAAATCKGAPRDPRTAPLCRLRDPP